MDSKLTWVKKMTLTKIIVICEYYSGPHRCKNVEEN